MKLAMTLVIVLALINPSTLGAKRQYWCEFPLSEGQIIRTQNGKFFLYSNLQAREIKEASLIKWYQQSNSTRHSCTIRKADFLEMIRGEEIEGRPDQSFEQPLLIAALTNPQEKFLWYRGRVQKLELPSKYLKLKDARLYLIDKLTLDNLPKGPPINASHVLEGTLVVSNHKHYILTRKGLRPIRQQVLRKLDLNCYGPLMMASNDLKQWPKAKSFIILDHDDWPDNVLIRGSHPERIYLLKGGKRYAFWNRHTLKKMGHDLKAILKISDDELYLIPYDSMIF